MEVPLIPQEAILNLPKVPNLSNRQLREDTKNKSGYMGPPIPTYCLYVHIFRSFGYSWLTNLTQKKYYLVILGCIIKPATDHIF